MRFDRLNNEGGGSGIGELYWIDLRFIRESKGIAIDTVHEKTRVPMEILSSFEREGLAGRSRMNRVYRRSLVAAYARAIDIDPDDVLRSVEETELGRYRGRLAGKYLGFDADISSGETNFRSTTREADSVTDRSMGDGA